MTTNVNILNLMLRTRDQLSVSSIEILVKYFSLARIVLENVIIDHGLARGRMGKVLELRLEKGLHDILDELQAAEQRCVGLAWRSSSVESHNSDQRSQESISSLKGEHHLSSFLTTLIGNQTD